VAGKGGGLLQVAKKDFSLPVAKKGDWGKSTQPGTLHTEIAVCRREDLKRMKGTPIF